MLIRIKKGSNISLAKYGAPNFTSHEVDCHCKYSNCKETIFETGQTDNLQKLRNTIGVVLTIWPKGGSFYRCDRHNAKVGGAKYSRHKKGWATDLKSPILPPEVVAYYCDKIWGTGELVIYNGFVHIAVGSKKRLDKRTGTRKAFRPMTEREKNKVKPSSPPPTPKVDEKEKMFEKKYNNLKIEFDKLEKRCGDVIGVNTSLKIRETDLLMDVKNLTREIEDASRLEDSNDKLIVMLQEKDEEITKLTEDLKKEKLKIVDVNAKINRGSVKGLISKVKHYLLRFIKKEVSK